MSHTSIFVSFDGDHDADLHELLQVQASRAGTSFDFSAHSLAGEMTDSWTSRSRSRIRASDVVMVICGEHTEDSPRVAAELRIAQEEERPYFLVWGRRERMCTKPKTAKPADGMYGWTWENLQDQIGMIRRAARSDARMAELSRTKGAAKGDSGRSG